MENENQPQIKLTSSRQRILADIKELGYETQNQQLICQGFVQLSQNRRYLIKFNGYLEQVIEALKQKNALREERRRAKVKDTPEGLESAKKSRRTREPKERKPKREKSERVRKEKKERLSLVALQEYEEIPSYIERIYLDGNNMLFIEDSIRRLVLGKNRKRAEEILADIAYEFGLYLGAKFDIILVYDHSDWGVEKKIISEEKSSEFTVLSASPKYKSSDDALVNWAQELGSDSVKKSLFVTSDRELQVRLSEAGASDIMKPGRWLKIVKKKLGEEKYHSLLSQ